MQEHNDYKHHAFHNDGTVLDNFGANHNEPVDEYDDLNDDDDVTVFWVDKHDGLVTYDNRSDTHLTGAARNRAITALLNAVYRDDLPAGTVVVPVEQREQRDERSEPRLYRVMFEHQSDYIARLHQAIREAVAALDGQ